MPDLSYKAVHQFWHEYQDANIYRVIAFMEGFEDWTLDGNPDLETQIKKLGDILDTIGSLDLQLEEDFIQFCAHIKISRALRLLMCIDTAYPGSAAKVLMKAEQETKSEDDVPGIFLRRNIVFERLRLLGRVFAADRFKIIQKALEEGGL